MNHIKTAAIAAVTVIAAASNANIVINGDFEAGNVGFTTGYTYVAPGPGALNPQGVYTVDDDPNDSHSAFTSMGDHTTGTGMMMIVNGMSGNTNVWSQTVAGLTVGTAYDFCAYGSSVHPTSPATLDLMVDGVSIDQFALTSTTNNWIKGCATFTASATSVVLSIQDTNGAATGNDFAIDDVSLAAVPEPATVAALGIGVVALLHRRRSRS